MLYFRQFFPTVNKNCGFQTSNCICFSFNFRIVISRRPKLDLHQLRLSFPCSDLVRIDWIKFFQMLKSETGYTTVSSAFFVCTEVGTAFEKPDKGLGWFNPLLHQGLSQSKRNQVREISWEVLFCGFSSYSQLLLSPHLILDWSQSIERPRLRLALPLQALSAVHVPKHETKPNMPYQIHRLQNVVFML